MQTLDFVDNRLDCVRDQFEEKTITSVFVVVIQYFVFMYAMRPSKFERLNRHEPHVFGR